LNKTNVTAVKMDKTGASVENTYLNKKDDSLSEMIFCSLE